jgi:N-acetyl-anhydromuramyl-L-alanine amidase AmpD
MAMKTTSPGALLISFSCFLSLFLSTLLFAALQIKESFNVTQERLNLTREYAKRHYGMDTYQLVNPQAIVIHYTATRNLQDTWSVFKPDRISEQRPNLARFGAVNVGVHYVVDRDGSIYRMLPDNMMGRHAIGLNYCAIGIENVGLNAQALTPDQLQSNVRLVEDLLSRHASIRFLLGHHELPDRAAPHAILLKMNEPENKPEKKSDPGPVFMRDLRAALDRQGIHLEK